MKRIILLFIIIFTLTGCSSYTELNDLSIVNTLGIDYIDNNYLIKLSVIEDIDNIKVYSSSDTNLLKALDNIYLTSNKKLYLSHIDLVILTPNIINNKLNEVLDNFLRNNEYRNNFQVVLMDSNSFNNFFLNKRNSKDITDLIDINSKETSIVYKKELENFLNDILIDKNSYLPTISYDQDILVEGYTLLKNNKIYEKADIKESILLNILTNKTNRVYIDDITIYSSTTNIKTNKNKIDIDIYLSINKKDKEKIVTLKKDLNSFLNKYLNKNYDILKLKQLVKKNNYSYYKNTNNLIKKLDIKIKINTKLEKDYIKGDIYEK